MKEKFIDWNPASATLATLAEASAILNEYQNMGYRLTLRKLYYQLVARDIIENSVRSYKRIGSMVSQGRLSGLLDWARIEDRVRRPSTNSHWESGADILAAAGASFYLDRWIEQENYVEVWCEKDAVSNIIEPVCQKWDVLFMANRGYSSQSAMYSASKRYAMARRAGKKLHLIYLGDHDPSGIDMTRDIKDRLGTFLIGEGLRVRFVDRAALNMDQVETYGPPENPAKMTDSGYADYAMEYGSSSWELDALAPAVLSGVVDEGIRALVDVDLLEETQERETIIKDMIDDLATQWTDPE